VNGSQRHEPERNAGAFLAPNGTFAAPMHTLSDEVPREPDEAEVERRGSDPRERPHVLRGRIRRWLARTDR
jgi:hypothetical protein